MECDLVIFDCDGVLVDSETASNQVISRNLSRYGLSLSVLECKNLFVGGTIRGVGEIARGMGADLPEDWIDEIYDEIYARLQAGVPLVPGVADVLDHLDAHDMAVCVASNGSPDKMRITLGQNGLWTRFENAMFSAHVLGSAKPNPTLFLAAAQHFGARSPVVIEDSASGAEAARRAGFTCLGFAPHGDGSALSAQGARVFRDMRDLTGLLGL